MTDKPTDYETREQLEARRKIRERVERDFAAMGGKLPEETSEQAPAKAPRTPHGIELDDARAEAIVATADYKALDALVDEIDTLVAQGNGLELMAGEMRNVERSDDAWQQACEAREKARVLKPDLGPSLERIDAKLVGQIRAAMKRWEWDDFPEDEGAARDVVDTISHAIMWHADVK